MYRSYPLVLSYLMLLAIAVIGIVYEVYMGFSCGPKDCFFNILIVYKPSLEEHYEKAHKSSVILIAVFWKIKQQLLLGLGLFQWVIIYSISVHLNLVN